MWTSKCISFGIRKKPRFDSYYSLLGIDTWSNHLTFRLSFLNCKMRFIISVRIKLYNMCKVMNIK